jgi:hypothetical protein
VIRPLCPQTPPRTLNIDGTQVKEYSSSQQTLERLLRL